MARDVAAYLEDQKRKSKNPEIENEWTALELMYNKKLYHQLTLHVEKFVKRPIFEKGDALIKMYQQFISDFEHRIKPLSLAEIALCVSRQYKDRQEAAEFLEKIRGKVKESTEAIVLCMTAIGNIKLEQKDFEAAKQLIRDAEILLDTLDGVTTVHGRYYEMSSNYHLLMGKHAEYYRDVLRYLGCMDDINQIPNLVDQAYNVGLAAILGKGVYNFGELLAHPILECLRKDVEKGWLVELLQAFNCGDITKFESLEKKWSTQADLLNMRNEMRQKITILCLMEMTFKRPATKRLITFAEIAREAHIEMEEVELLLMKALSLGLVKGHIDGVDQTVQMTWVQPRVLNISQISTMQQHIARWCTDVQKMQNLVEDNAKEILT